MASRLSILQGDWVERLRELPDGSVHCTISSPPYWGLRDYGVPGQLGLEKTPEEYVAKIVAGFREVRRVLRDDGMLWLNLGDSYARNGGEPGGGNRELLHMEGKQLRMTQIPDGSGLKPKDLVGMPWRVAFALQADGWYLRSDNIWSKPNPMPESVTDRPTKAHEYLFLLTKQPRYFYDAEAIKEPSVTGDNRSPYGSDGAWAMEGRNKWDEGKGEPRKSDATMRNKRSVWRVDDHKALFYWLYTHAPDLLAEFIEQSRNKLDVWTVTTAPFKGSHFATFPPDLVKPCILAGTSARGCCPKCSAPWQRIVETIGRKGRSWHNHENDEQTGQSKSGSAPQISTQTLGWEPICDCAGCDDRPGLIFEQQHPEFIPIPCTILDPFLGSGTTAQVALELGRKCIGIELNPDYIELIKQRTQVTPGLQLA